MKSYGVHIGAGAVTLLFGAYAAAVAQKDSQNESSSWTVQASDTNGPAAPIEDMSDDSWLKQPATPLADDNSQPATQLDTQRSPGGDEPADQAIQFVQHTEDIQPSSEGEQVESSDTADGPSFGVGMPATLGVPSATPQSDLGTNDDESINDSPDASWLMPEGDAVVSPDAPGSAAAMSMTLPTIGGDSSAVTANEGDASNESDELVVTDIPAMEFYPAESISIDEAAAAPPANLLRGTPEGDNALQYDADGASADLTVVPGDEAPESQRQTMPNAYSHDANSHAPNQIASLSSDPRSLSSPTARSLEPTGMSTAVPMMGSAAAIEPAATLDSPGERRLEGAQSPSIVIQKRAPAEVKVGKPASFVVHVQNVGAVEALNVEVHDQVPAGMRLIDASPTPIQQGNQLLWQLGAMTAGDERTITMQLLPEQEGELGSVARVSFEAAASVRTLSTRPELKIVQRVPEQGVLIGQQLEIELEVSNPGSGAANNVILQEDVPEGLDHPKGRQLDNALGTLAPGEVRRQVLRLRAVSPGVIQNTIRLHGEDGLSAEHTVSIQVVAPNLQIELSGPSKRFLERQATYQLNLANNGTADATNVEVSVQLSRGFTFVSTDHEGQYDPARHSVFWSLAQLPAGAKGSVPLTLLPVEAGEQLIKTEARADLGVVATNERKMTVDGFAELSFAISNAGGPIEIGAETNYEVVVTNSGSKPDTNVRVQLQLPPGLELVSASGDAKSDGRGTVVFPPRTQLAPREELKYAFRVRGTSPGSHIVRAVVVSDHSTVPVTKEESTRVYEDQ
jgi:uncharacterized repeat protein (TIGR01451 family)